MGAKACAIGASMATVLKALIGYFQRNGIQRFAQAQVQLFGGMGQKSENRTQALVLSSDR